MEKMGRAGLQEAHRRPPTGDPPQEIPHRRPPTGDPHRRPTISVK